MIGGNQRRDCIHPSVACFGDIMIHRFWNICVFNLGVLWFGLIENNDFSLKKMKTFTMFLGCYVIQMDSNDRFFQSHFEFIAWIIIVGLPIKILSDSNFNKIISNFGRIIISVDGIKNHVDLSFVKVGILTSVKKKLNKELSVLLKGSSL